MTGSCYSLLYFAEHVGWDLWLIQLTGEPHVALGSQQGWFLLQFNISLQASFWSKPVLVARSRASSRSEPCSLWLPFVVWLLQRRACIISSAHSGDKAEEEWPLGYNDSLPLENNTHSPGIQMCCFKCHSTTAISVQLCGFQAVFENQSHPILASC